MDKILEAGISEDVPAASGGLRIGVLGSGMMAQALVKGWIQSGTVPADSIITSDPSQHCQAAIRAMGAASSESNEVVITEATIIFIAVKPDAVRELLQKLKSRIQPHHLLVSIAAGVTLSTLEGILPEARFVRVMPNTPCLVQACASAIACGRLATKADGDLVVKLMSSVGICETVKEKEMDAVTGLSGSGPAYAFLAIEALADGGVLAGLPRAVALKLAAQTMLGAAKMVLETGKHPGELKDQVASPGGTTIAGIHELEKAGFRGALMNAVYAAALKAHELGSKNS